MSAPESPSPFAPEPDLDAAFWQAVGEAWPDGLLVLDGKGRILAVNHAATALLGDGQSEFLQQILACGQAEAPFVPLPDNFPVAHADGIVEVIQTHWATVPGLKGGTLRIGLLRSQSDGAVCDAMLVRSEEQLASVTANLPGVVFQRVMTPDGTIRYPFFTEGIRRVVGFAPEEMRVTSDGCLDLVHWADRADHLAAIRRSAQDLTPCVEEFRAITKDGEVRWLQGSSRPRMLTDGSLQWDGVLIDVSDRKRAEQTLQMIMDHAADSIITLNVQGRMESVNAAVESLFGYSVSELIGQSVSMLMPEPYRSQHDEFVARYLESGEGQILGKGPRELVGLRKDGTIFPFEIATSEVRLEGRRLFIGIGRDITARKKTETALRETEQRLANVAANLPGIVFQRLLRPDGQLEYPYVSEAIRDLLGIDPADAVANPRLLLDTIAPEMMESFMLNLRRSARTLEPFEEDLLVFAASGEETWMRTRSRPRLLPDGAVIWEGVMLDVTDRKRAEDQLSFLAYHDPLTKAVTRDRLLERFAEAAPEALAGGEILALASIGIDRFSFINTTLGHSLGDELLVKLAERLTSCLSEGDILARVGGDRFMLMLTGMSDAAEIMITIEQILTRLCDPFHLNDEEIELTASIGVSLYPEDGESGEALVKNADAALLRSKSAGPGTIQRFVPEMNAGVARTLSLQNRLRRALEQEEFVPFYQPQVELSEGRIVGMEALVRWMSPGGMISPAEFIPVAEECGLIDGICEQMLRACCRQIRHWQAEGLPVVPVAVNISGRQFHQPKRLVHALETVLAETGLEPHFLELELTESSAMSDPDSAISVVSMLRDRGLVCSIDDFGTGYSSLSVLKSFPINKLKIDRSFVMDIASDPNDAAIVTAIIAMAHALKLKVVAEGVETQDHLEFLRDLGCDQIQGYLFSRPLPASDMRTMLAEDRRLALPTKK